MHEALFAQDGDTFAKSVHQSRTTTLTDWDSTQLKKKYFLCLGVFCNNLKIGSSCIFWSNLSHLFAFVKRISPKDMHTLQGAYKKALNYCFLNALNLHSQHFTNSNCIHSKLHTGAKTHFLSRNSLDFGSSKMWILWKMRFQKCEFCENWDFRNVNFVKN